MLRHSQTPTSCFERTRLLYCYNCLPHSDWIWAIRYYDYFVYSCSHLYACYLCCIYLSACYFCPHNYKLISSTLFCSISTLVLISSVFCRKAERSSINSLFSLDFSQHAIFFSLSRLYSNLICFSNPAFCYSSCLLSLECSYIISSCFPLSSYRVSLRVHNCSQIRLFSDDRRMLSILICYSCAFSRLISLATSSNYRSQTPHLLSACLVRSFSMAASIFRRSTFCSISASFSLSLLLSSAVFSLVSLSFFMELSAFWLLFVAASSFSNSSCSRARKCSWVFWCSSSSNRILRESLSVVLDSSLIFS